MALRQYQQTFTTTAGGAVALTPVTPEFSGTIESIRVDFAADFDVGGDTSFLTSKSGLTIAALVATATDVTLVPGKQRTTAAGAAVSGEYVPFKVLNEAVNILVADGGATKTVTVTVLIDAENVTGQV